MTVHEKIGTFRHGGRAKLTTWIYQIAKNRAIDYHRSAKPEPEPLGVGQTIRQHPDGGFAGRNRTKSAAPVISENQKRPMFALANEHGVNTDDLKNYLFTKHNFAHSKDVTRERYEEICGWIMSGGNGRMQ